MKSNEDLVIDNKNTNSNLQEPNSNYYIKRKGIFKENAKFYFIIMSILVILYFGIILVIGILRIIEFFICWLIIIIHQNIFFTYYQWLEFCLGFISFIIIFIVELKLNSIKYLRII